ERGGAAAARVAGVTRVAGVARVAGAADGDVGAAAALVALGRQDLVVVGAEVQAGPGQGVEVVADGDGAAGPLLLPHAPELLEGPGALDGGRVVPPGLVDVVRT